MGSGLGGWHWLSQHLVASLKHCQSLVQDLPSAEILTAAIIAVIGSVCVRAMQQLQLSLCLITGCVMKVPSLLCLNFCRSNIREAWLASMERESRQILWSALLRECGVNLGDSSGVFSLLAEFQWLQEHSCLPRSFLLSPAMCSHYTQTVFNPSFGTVP